VLACGDAPAEPPVRLRARVIRPESDTTRFATGAVARPCRGAMPATLLEGAATDGAGVLLLLRHGDALAPATYPLTALGDSTTAPGAQAAARYVVGDVAHGFALDSGTVAVTRDDATITARVAGRGLEGAVRLGLEAEFEAVPFGADSAACRLQ
jgi:hypothetical protein